MSNMLKLQHGAGSGQMYIEDPFVNKMFTMRKDDEMIFLQELTYASNLLGPFKNSPDFTSRMIAYILQPRAANVDTPLYNQLSTDAAEFVPSTQMNDYSTSSVNVAAPMNSANYYPTAVINNFDIRSLLFTHDNLPPAGVKFIQLVQQAYDSLPLPQQQIVQTAVVNAQPENVSDALTQAMASVGVSFEGIIQETGGVNFHRLLQTNMGLMSASTSPFASQNQFTADAAGGGAALWDY